MKMLVDQAWVTKMAELEEGHEVGAGSPHHILRVPSLYLQFKRTITRIAHMNNGHIRVFFDNDTALVVMSNPKRGLVLPRRRRAEARKKGLI